MSTQKIERLRKKLVYFIYIKSVGCFLRYVIIFFQIYHLIAEMKDIYNNIKICPFKGFNNYCDMRLDPDIIRTMAHSRNYDELQYIWSEWRKKTAPTKNKFMRYVQLANQAATAMGKI